MQTLTLKGFHLSPQQARLWTWQQRPGPWAVQACLDLEGPLQLPILHQAFTQLVQRHAILRTRLHPVPGMQLPLQRHEPAALVSVPLLDLQNLEASVQQQRLTQVQEQAWQTPFDLSQEAPLRVVLVQIHAQRYRLIVTLSALCADAATLPVLLSGLASLYETILSGSSAQEG